MKRKTKVYIYNVIVILLLLAGLGWVISKFVHIGNVEYTDNAYVHRQVTPVNARVSGFVQEVRFAEYQPVHKGDTLLILDDSEFRVQLAQAEAALANAQASHNAASTTVGTMDSNIGVTDASIAESKAQLDVARKDDERYSRLLARDAVTQSEYDRVHTAFLAAEARYNGLQQARKSTTSTKQEMGHRVDQTEAVIKAAQAQIDFAKLNMSYCVVTAPCDGLTGKKTINEGQLVQPGHTLLDIVDSSDVWIVANFREKQLKNIRPGANVRLSVDAYPDRAFTGVVESVSDATGAAVSIIPTDNATGNFVKVEQRVPVRISVRGDQPDDCALLRAGMSVECEVEY